MDTGNDRAQLELFLQGQGLADITIVRVPRDGTVHAIVEAAVQAGLRTTGGTRDVLVLLEDSDDPLPLHTSLKEAGIGNRARVHVHRCRQVSVTVNFNGAERKEHFPPSARVARVMRWAVGRRGFNLTETDAADHVLQICGTPDNRPDDDTHIGRLVDVPDCSLCFDLVPKQRVEG